MGFVEASVTSHCDRGIQMANDMMTIDNRDDDNNFERSGKDQPLAGQEQTQQIPAQSENATVTDADDGTEKNSASWETEQTGGENSQVDNAIKLEGERIDARTPDDAGEVTVKPNNDHGAVLRDVGDAQRNEGERERRALDLPATTPRLGSANLDQAVGDAVGEVARELDETQEQELTPPVEGSEKENLEHGEGDGGSGSDSAAVNRKDGLDDGAGGEQGAEKVKSVDPWRAPRTSLSPPAAAVEQAKTEHNGSNEEFNVCVTASSPVSGEDRGEEHEESSKISPRGEYGLESASSVTIIRVERSDEKKRCDDADMKKRDASDNYCEDVKEGSSARATKAEPAAIRSSSDVGGGGGGGGGGRGSGVGENSHPVDDDLEEGELAHPSPPRPQAKKVPATAAGTRKSGRQAPSAISADPTSTARQETLKLDSPTPTGSADRSQGRSQPLSPNRSRQGGHETGAAAARRPTRRENERATARRTDSRSRDRRQGCSPPLSREWSGDSFQQNRSSPGHSSHRVQERRGVDAGEGKRTGGSARGFRSLPRVSRKANDLTTVRLEISSRERDFVSTPPGSSSHRRSPDRFADRSQDRSNGSSGTIGSAVSSRRTSGKIVGIINGSNNSGASTNTDSNGKRAHTRDRSPDRSQNDGRGKHGGDQSGEHFRDNLARPNTRDRPADRSGKDDHRTLRRERSSKLSHHDDARNVMRVRSAEQFQDRFLDRSGQRKSVAGKRARIPGGRGGCDGSEDHGYHKRIRASVDGGEALRNETAPVSRNLGVRSLGSPGIRRGRTDQSDGTRAGPPPVGDHRNRQRCGRSRSRDRSRVGSGDRSGDRSRDRSSDVGNRYERADRLEERAAASNVEKTRGSYDERSVERSKERSAEQFAQADRTSSGGRSRGSKRDRAFMETDGMSRKDRISQPGGVTGSSSQRGGRDAERNAPTHKIYKSRTPTPTDRSTRRSVQQPLRRTAAPASSTSEIAPRFDDRHGLITRPSSEGEGSKSSSRRNGFKDGRDATHRSDDCGSDGTSPRQGSSFASFRVSPRGRGRGGRPPPLSTTTSGPTTKSDLALRRDGKGGRDRVPATTTPVTTTAEPDITMRRCKEEPGQERGSDVGRLPGSSKIFMPTGGTIQHNRGCAAGTYGQARTMVEDDQEHVHVKKEIVAQVAGATGGLGWEEEGVDLPSNMLGKTPDFKAEGGGNCVALKFANDREVDERRLAQRQRQIDFGKNTKGYDLYLQAVPIHRRGKHHPCTPDKEEKLSKREFSWKIRVWRRKLHTWDESGTPPSEQSPSSSSSEEGQVKPPTQNASNTNAGTTGGTALPRRASLSDDDVAGASVSPTACSAPFKPSRQAASSLSGDGNSGLAEDNVAVERGGEGEGKRGGWQDDHEGMGVVASDVEAAGDDNFNANIYAMDDDETDDVFGGDGQGSAASLSELSTKRWAPLTYDSESDEGVVEDSDPDNSCSDGDGDGDRHPTGRRRRHRGRRGGGGKRRGTWLGGESSSPTQGAFEELLSDASNMAITEDGSNPPAVEVVGSRDGLATASATREPTLPEPPKLEEIEVGGYGPRKGGLRDGVQDRNVNSDSGKRKTPPAIKAALLLADDDGNRDNVNNDISSSHIGGDNDRGKERVASPFSPPRAHEGVAGRAFHFVGGGSRGWGKGTSAAGSELPASSAEKEFHRASGVIEGRDGSYSDGVVSPGRGGGWAGRELHNNTIVPRRDAGGKDPGMIAVKEEAQPVAVGDEEGDREGEAALDEESFSDDDLL